MINHFCLIFFILGCFGSCIFKRQEAGKVKLTQQRCWRTFEETQHESVLWKFVSKDEACALHI